MKRTALLLTALLLAAGTARAQSLAFTDVTVIDVAEGVAEPGMTVVIAGGGIAAVGESGEVEVPAGATVIDGGGKYLIPGLWDMHVHTSRGGRATRFFPLFLAHGVTGVRDTGSYADSLLYWRARSERPDVLAPRVEITSPSLRGDSPPPRPGMGGPFEILVADAASATAVVDSLAERGIDVIKVYDGLPREAYFAIAERTRERGMSFVGHVPLSVSLAEASDAGQRSFEHVTELLMPCIPGAGPLATAHARAVARHGATSDSARAAVGRLMGALAFAAPDAAECGGLLGRMAANGTWLTPTLAVYKGETQPSNFDGDPRLRWMPPALAERWRAGRRMTPEEESEFGSRIMGNALRTVAIVHRAGVGILAGTDASDMPYIFAGSSLHDELAMYVEAGMTPLQALQTATLNPARFFGRTDELGAVEEGKLADLVLLDANPLEDITNTQRIRAVVADGRYFDREALDELLKGVELAAQD